MKTPEVAARIHEIAGEISGEYSGLAVELRAPAFAALKPGYKLIGAFAATYLRDKTKFRLCRPRT